MSHLTYTYKPHYSSRPFIRQFDSVQISTFLKVYKRWRNFESRINYSRLRDELSNMFSLRDERKISRILAEINQVRPNFRSFATMYSSMDEQIEDILDQFREEFNQGSYSDYEDEEYNSYAS